MAGIRREAPGRCEGHPPRHRRGSGNALAGGGDGDHSRTGRAQRLRRAPPRRGRAANPVLGPRGRPRPREAQAAPAPARPGLHRGTTTRAARARDLGTAIPRTRAGWDRRPILRGQETVYQVQRDGSSWRSSASSVDMAAQAWKRSQSQSLPRVVAGLDENRLAGYAGLPIASQPVLREIPARRCWRRVRSPPLPGDYAVAFDSGGRARGGPLHLPLLDRRREPTHASAADARCLAGARCCRGGRHRIGRVPGRSAPRSTASPCPRRSTRRRPDPTSGFASGSHRLLLRVSDYQETKNTENVARILPNTRKLAATSRFGSCLRRFRPSRRPPCTSRPLP